MRKIFLACLCAPLMLSALTAEDQPQKALTPVHVNVFRKNIDPNEYVDTDKAAKLFAKRDKTIVDMYEARTKIIKSNPRAAKIQREIDELAKKLAVIVENDPEMHKLNLSMNKTDAEINALQKKKTNGK